MERKGGSQFIRPPDALHARNHTHMLLACIGNSFPSPFDLSYCSHRVKVFSKMDEYNRVRELKNAPLRKATVIGSVPVVHKDEDDGGEAIDSRSKKSRMVVPEDAIDAKTGEKCKMSFLDLLITCICANLRIGGTITCTRIRIVC